MDIANEIADYIDDLGYGTAGTDIFVGQMPIDTKGIYIIRTGGVADNYTPFEETVLDIYTVNTSSKDSIGVLENIKRSMHRMHNTNTANSYIYSMLLIGDVEDVARDTEYHKIYKITLQVTHRSTDLIS